MPKGIKGFQNGHITSEETKKKIGDANRGRKYGQMSQVQRTKISQALKGKLPKFIPDNKGRIHTKEWIENWKQSRTFAKGAEHHNWKGGITPVNHKIRTSTKYKNWRKAIFDRDNYTCLICGQYGGSLQVDHIKPFSTHPKLRFKKSNGRTLCKPCHLKTETWGYNVKKYEEIKSV